MKERSHNREANSDYGDGKVLSSPGATVSLTTESCHRLASAHFRAPLSCLMLGFRPTSTGPRTIPPLRGSLAD
jgi:hypothetical protein